MQHLRQFFFGKDMIMAFTNSLSTNYCYEETIKQTHQYNCQNCNQRRHISRQVNKQGKGSQIILKGTIKHRNTSNPLNIIRKDALLHQTAHIFLCQSSLLDKHPILSIRSNMIQKNKRVLYLDCK